MNFQSSRKIEKHIIRRIEIVNAGIEDLLEDIGPSPRVSLPEHRLAWIRIEDLYEDIGPPERRLAWLRIERGILRAILQD